MQPSSPSLWLAGIRSSLHTYRVPHRVQGMVHTVQNRTGEFLALMWLIFKGLGSREEMRIEDRQ